MRVDVLREANGFFNGVAGFTGQADDEGAVDLDPKLMAIGCEPPCEINAHSFLDVKQDLLVACFVAYEQQTQAVVLEDL